MKSAKREAWEFIGGTPSAKGQRFYGVLTPYNRFARGSIDRTSDFGYEQPQMLTMIQKLVPSLLSSHSEFVPSWQMKTILYVEDDEHDLFFLTRAFTTQAPDLRVENVTSVADAIEYLSGK